MSRAEIASDGAVIARTFGAPARGLADAVLRRRTATSLAVSTLAALAFAAVAAPRTDFAREASARLDSAPKAAETTPREREEALATASKVGQVGMYASAALAPTLSALGAAAFLWLAFRVAGTRPPFRASFAAAAHGLLPVWMVEALAIPAAIARAPLRTAEVGRLLPSSLSALLPATAPPVLADALGALDLFALWAVALVALGMASASGASRRRALAVTALLFLAYAAVVHVALPALARGGPPPAGG